jgi:uncharacterized protein YukJ
VKSISEVLYIADDQYDTKAITILQTLKNGFTRINQRNRDISLDYIRGNIIKNRKEMVPLPQNIDGPSNDLNDFIHEYIKNSKSNNDIIYVFGSKFESENKEDSIFGFEPEQGIHDVHMNQGNYGSWKKDNGIWQDGGILLQKEDKWIAIFLAFLTQSWCTDEQGNPKKQCTYKD